MRKITKEEFLKTPIIKRGRQQSEFCKNVLALELDEALFIGKEEWERKTDPAMVVSQLKIRTGREFKTNKTLSEDWIVLRIK